MIRDSITILKGIPKLFVNHDMNKNTIFFVSPAKNSKPPSGGTINTDRCLTLIRDAAHSETFTDFEERIKKYMYVLWVHAEFVLVLASSFLRDTYKHFRRGRL